MPNNVNIILTACWPSVLLTGAGVYQRLTQRDRQAYDQRTCAQYLAAKVRQAPGPQSVSLSSFGDSASVSAYALEAVRWAAGEGLISGTDAGLLAPQGSATRAQVATILMRFVESLTK